MESTCMDPEATTGKKKREKKWKKKRMEKGRKWEKRGKKEENKGKKQKYLRTTIIEKIGVLYNKKENIIFLKVFIIDLVF